MVVSVSSLVMFVNISIKVEFVIYRRLVLFVFFNS